MREIPTNQHKDDTSSINTENHINQPTEHNAPEPINEGSVNPVIYVDEPEEEPIEESTELKEEPSTEESIIDPSEKTEESSKRKPHSVLQDFDINSPVKLTTGDEITLPSNFDKETREVLDKTPNINILDDPQSREWARNLADGLELTTYNETFVATLEDTSAEFRQRMEHNGLNLSAQAPKFKPMENQNIKGERAVIRLISHLGLGTLFQVPLWHSGLWVTFKPPTDSEIIELNRSITSDKIRFGRYTYGLAFSNISSYTTNRLIDFAISHIYDLTSKSEDININNIKSHISCQDIPSFLWGFACTMYPRGFKYRRSCSNDPEKCNYILEDTLNVSKLQWTNMNALTDWQKTFMSSRQSKVKDLASIMRYKEELNKIQKKKISINEGSYNEVSITIKTPNISEHVEAGYRWIGDIVDSIERTIGMDVSDNDRDNYITRHGQASAMRQYSHWVDSIEYDSNVIDDLETIEKTLDVLSTDDEVRGQFIEGVVNYINNSTISVIGIPVYDCPKCNKGQDTDIKLPHHTNIIPLDIIQLFFELLVQRISRLAER